MRLAEKVIAVVAVVVVVVVLAFAVVIFVFLRGGERVGVRELVQERVAEEGAGAERGERERDDADASRARFGGRLILRGASTRDEGEERERDERDARRRERREEGLRAEGPRARRGVCFAGRIVTATVIVMVVVIVMVMVMVIVMVVVVVVDLGAARVRRGAGVFSRGSSASSSRAAVCSGASRARRPPRAPPRLDARQRDVADDENVRG